MLCCGFALSDYLFAAIETACRRTAGNRTPIRFIFPPATEITDLIRILNSQELPGTVLSAVFTEECYQRTQDLLLELRISDGHTSLTPVLLFTYSAENRISIRLPYPGFYFLQLPCNISRVGMLGELRSITQEERTQYLRGPGKDFVLLQTTRVLEKLLHPFPKDIIKFTYSLKSTENSEAMDSWKGIHSYLGPIRATLKRQRSKLKKAGVIPADTYPEIDPLIDLFDKCHSCFGFSIDDLKLWRKRIIDLRQPLEDRRYGPLKM